MNFDNVDPSEISAKGTKQIIVDGFTRTVTDRQGAFGELIIKAGGVTLTISRLNGSMFDLVDNGYLPDPNDPADPLTPFQAGKIDPATGEDHFGAVSLDPFFDTSNDPFLFSFDTTIRSFSLLAGDYGGDLDSMLMYAFSSPDPQMINPGSFTFNEATLPGSPVIDFLPSGGSTWTETRYHYTNEDGFQSIVFIGGNNNLSVFIDQLFFSLAYETGDSLDNRTDELNNSPGDEDFIITPEPATIAMLGLMGLAAIKRNRK